MHTNAPTWTDNLCPLSACPISLRHFSKSFLISSLPSTFLNSNSFSARRGMKVTIVGGGIIGLTTALFLQDEGVAESVEVLAEGFGKETTSWGAAGIFRPGGGLRFSLQMGDGVEQQVPLDRPLKTSHAYYSSLLSEPSTGVSGLSGYILSSHTQPRVHKALQPLLPAHRIVELDEVSRVAPNRKNLRFGEFFDTLVVESGQFLEWAGRRILERGGKISRCPNLTRLDDLPGDLIVNCTGLGARKLCNDDRVVPIRGQVFKVKAPWVKMFMYEDVDTYIIPTSSGIVTLGGTRNFDSTDTRVDKYDSARIWERATDLMPSLARAEIVREWVGLRPYRDGGARLGWGNQDKVIHNYGHGGYGVTMAPGSADIVVECVREWRKRGRGSKMTSRL